MSDPFVERMMERARKRREALGHIPPSGGKQENKENTSTKKSPLKHVSESYKDESKNIAPCKSSENTAQMPNNVSPQKNEFSTSKRPTNLDDYRNVPSSVDDAKILEEGNEPLPKESNCKPCTDNEMHDPEIFHNSDDKLRNVSSPVRGSTKTGSESTCSETETTKYLFGENLKVDNNKDRPTSFKVSPNKPNVPSVTSNTEPKPLASIISPKKSSINISLSTTPKFKTPGATKTKYSSNSELKQISANASAKKIEWDQSLISSLESQGFTPSDSHSHLVVGFKKEQINSLDSIKKDLFQPPSPPPPPPKVVKCTAKSPIRSSENYLTTANFTTAQSRSPSPSKVVEMRSRWEQNIKKSSPDRQEHRSRSTSPSKVGEMRSRWEQNLNKSSPDRRGHQSRNPTRTPTHCSGRKVKSASSLKPEDRSRSPVKSASNLTALYRTHSSIKTDICSLKSAFKSTSPNKSSISQNKEGNGNTYCNNFQSVSPNKSSTIIKPEATMPETTPLLDDPYHSSVKDRAAAFGGAGAMKDSKRDPAEMSLQERRILFEKQKDAALVPKAPFGQAIPTKLLQEETNNKYSQPVKKPIKKFATEPSKAISERIGEIQKDCSTDDTLNSFEANRRLVESRKDNWQDTDINNKIQNERQKEMEVLMNRFRRPGQLTESLSAPVENSQRPIIQSTASCKQQVEHQDKNNFPKEEYDDECEESDISLAESYASEDTAAPVGPLTSPGLNSESDVSISGGKRQLSSSSSSSCSPSSKTSRSSSKRMAKRINSTEIEEVESDPCKEFIPKVNPGCLFPSLSDIESHSEAPDSQDSDDDDDDYDIKDSSFAESVLTMASMQSLGHKIKESAQQNSTIIGGKDLTNITEYSEIYHNTILKSPSKVENPNISESAMNVSLDIDDAIDEALTPTPPKRLRSVDDDSSSNYRTPRITISSTSSSGCNSAYKTPRLQTEASTEENHNTLTHSVSFYRKQRPIEMTYTPVRKIVRNDLTSPNPEPMDSPTVTISARIRELQEEVAAQQSVISQASSAVSVVLRKPETLEGTTQHIEAEKLLLLASVKRHQALDEIQRIKAEGALGQQDLDSCSGSISISNISLPLKQDFLQKGMKGDRIHHLLVLVKHRHQVMASQLMTTPSCVSDGQINFSGLMELNNLSSDFNIAIEVYGYSLFTKNQHNMKKDQSRMKLTPLKRLSKQEGRFCSPAVESPGGPYAVRSSAFTLMGFTNLNITTVTRNAWALEKCLFSSPLDGHLLMRVQCNMEGGITERGFITMFEDVGGFGSWNRRWCVLNGKYLRYWSYPDDENEREASGSIDLRSCINRRIEIVARDVCARQHTFQLTCQRPTHKGDKSNLVQEVQGDVVLEKLLLSADCKEERILWCNKLNKIIANIRAWDPDALRPEDYQV